MNTSRVEMEDVALDVAPGWRLDSAPLGWEVWNRFQFTVGERVR
jgi:hypothetical protein